MYLIERKDANMEFTNENFKKFRKDVDEALRSVGEKYGVDIQSKDISYSNYDFTLKLYVLKNDGNNDGKKQLFAEHCKFYGFEESDYEREFTVDGKNYKLVGFNVNSPKNCCSIYCTSNGNTYKCSSEYVKRGFAATKVS